MARKKTLEEFKNDVQKVHGDKYILDEVVYVDNKTKVKLLCPKHGEFWMTPNCLLSGQNCPQCAMEELSKRMTHKKEEVVKRLKQVHGDKYVFDNIEYVNMLTKVTVVCPQHGEFKMTPAHLLEGHGCPECAKNTRSIKRANTFEEFVQEAKTIHGDKYIYNDNNYINNRTKIVITCPIHGDFVQKPLDHIQGKGCPHCGHSISKAEEEIYSMLVSLVGENEIVRHDTNILDGLEIDIYLPNYKFGIEYNGLHWHSEAFGKDRNYHLNKTDKAESKGIHLIQIFEDEWLEHKDLVLEKLRHYIHKSEVKVVGARKCTIQEVNKSIAEEFLNKYHIQGYVTSTIYYGAFYDNELVGIMNFLREKEGMWNLTRFTTDYHYSIPGLANKIFKHFVRLNAANIIEVKTFLDRRWSHCDVNVYDKMGFKLEKIERPDYRYVVGNQRMHKFGFRKQKLNKKYGLPLTMTEREMCKELGFERIWDCGLYKYVWKNY